MKFLVPRSTDDIVNNFFSTYFTFLLLLFRRWPVLREGSNGESWAESVPVPECHGQDRLAVRMWGCVWRYFWSHFRKSRILLCFCYLWVWLTGRDLWPVIRETAELFNKRRIYVINTVVVRVSEMMFRLSGYLDHLGNHLVLNQNDFSRVISVNSATQRSEKIWLHFFFWEKKDKQWSYKEINSGVGL